MKDEGGKKTAIEKLAEHGLEVDPQVLAFRRDLILHERFQMALDELAERIQYGEQQSITAVLGPTGSGKTALVNEFGHQFQVAMTGVAEAARTTLLCMELAAPEHGPFKWRDDFYLPALEALKEPCTTRKINVEELRERLESGDTKPSYARKSHPTPFFRKLFYSALDRANTLAALFDEANHLRRPASKSGVFAQYDSIKSRSNACRTHFGLFGTIEIADIFEQSGPISKRVYPIWLSPYGPGEKQQFGNAVVSIVAKLGREITFSVAGKLDAIYEDTFGVFGLVHDWFDRALVRAVRLEKSKISWKDMLESAWHPRQLSGIATDLIRYRDVMRGVNICLKEKRALLLLPAANPVGTGDGRSGATAGKPGVRNPERDAVGL